MPEEFRHRINVRPDVEHKSCERMPPTVKRNRLIDSRFCHPQFESVIRARGGMNVGKDVFVGETSFPHKFSRLWRNIEILLSARFLLSEDDSGKLALFMNVAPR